MKNNSNPIVLQFSGGTDSTLAAALISQKFEEIHLLTYNRLGFTNIENSKLNVKKLQDKYTKNKFIHKIIPIDDLTRFVFYERYLHNLRKHGFFLINMCGLCKFAMHIQTILYCLKHEIYSACDGANQGMTIFPAQMQEGIQEIQLLYQHFGINFSNPVFHFEEQETQGIAERLQLQSPIADANNPKDKTTEEKNTTGCKLYDLGLMPSKNVKGSPLDRKMQARCFQFILFNIFVKWYFLGNHSYQEYAKEVNHLYRQKRLYFTNLIEDFQKDPLKSKLSRLVNL